MEKDKQNLIEKYNSIADKVSENKFWEGFVGGIFYGSILQFNISALYEPTAMLNEPMTLFLPVVTLINKLVSMGCHAKTKGELAKLKEKINLESKEIVKSSISNLSEEERIILQTVLSNKELLGLVCQINENNLADEVLTSIKYFRDNGEEKDTNVEPSYSERLSAKVKGRSNRG